MEVGGFMISVPTDVKHRVQSLSEPKRNGFIKNLMFEIFKKQIETQRINPFRKMIILMT
jgi:hypothetical protein